MPMYELRDHRGRPLALAEAADSADAELYAIREVSGFHRAVPVPQTDHGPALEDAFRRMGLSESGARIAATTRYTTPSLPLHRVTRQAARPVRSQPAPASERIISETTRRAR